MAEKPHNAGFIAFFVDRPIFASVIAFLIILAGSICVTLLPIASFPQVAPPEVSVSTQYIGASAEVVANTVTTPIEEAVNGVEGMMYMSSNSTNNGDSVITVTFEVGYDPDIAQVDVLTQTNQALAQLPSEVNQVGVTVEKQSDNLLLAVNLVSPNGTYDSVFLGNYADIHINDALLRIPGVATIINFGLRQYAIRIWLDPTKMANMGITGTDVAAAVREQNQQAAAGAIGLAPAGKDEAFSYQLNTEGRLSQVSQFEDIILRAAPDGSVVKLKDVARVELGAETYASSSKFDGKATGVLGIFQLADANALDIYNAVEAEMERLSKDFPDDVDYVIAYNTSLFVTASVKEVVKTLVQAILLVFIVVFLFVQSWRATLIPAVTIPVSLIGAFAIMQVFGFSINTLSLLGLVLAVGLVVDDAIVVVENVQRQIEKGGSDLRTMTLHAMAEVRGPIITTTLVLLSVFVPVAFMPGMTGSLYNQFALTVAFAIFLSAFNSLTLSPALCAILLRPASQDRKPNIVFRAFNTAFSAVSNAYGASVSILSKAWVLVFLAFAALCVALAVLLMQRPTAFVPEEDQGYFIVVAELPEAATAERTAAVLDEAAAILQKTPGVKHVMQIAGFDLIDSIDQPSAGVCFPILEPWDARKSPDLHVSAIIKRANKELSKISGARLFGVNPPPIPGLSPTGGFQGEIQDLNSLGSQRLAAVADAIMKRARERPEIKSVNTTFSADVPQRFLDIDREKAKSMGVSITDLFQTLQINLGSLYVNELNKFGRVYRVYLQADEQFRMTEQNVLDLKVRNASGDMIDLSTFVTIKPMVGPYNITHYQLYPSVSVLGTPADGYSSGQAIKAMESVTRESLPDGYTFAWTGLVYQQLKAGNLAPVLFTLSLVFTFFVLAAQYESWAMPVMVLLAVPLGLLGGLIGLTVRSMPLDVYGQIGLLVLIGLAAKNAILIVEFAKDYRSSGEGIIESAIEAARVRLRPILMTAFAFIFGVMPLVFATGAGAHSRQSLGTVVVFGMFVATMLIIMVPVFYVVIQKMREHFGHGKPGTNRPEL